MRRWIEFRLGELIDDQVVVLPLIQWSAALPQREGLSLLPHLGSNQRQSQDPQTYRRASTAPSSSEGGGGDTSPSARRGAGSSRDGLLKLNHQRPHRSR